MRHGIIVRVSRYDLVTITMSDTEHGAAMRRPMNFRKPHDRRPPSSHGRAAGATPVTALEPSAVQRAGNRFGQAGVLLAVLALLCAMVGELVPAAWAFALVGLLLAGAGFMLWCNGTATNVADAIVGFFLAHCVLMWLLFALSIQYPAPPIMYPVS
jgi:hypothetical protein